MADERKTRLFEREPIPRAVLTLSVPTVMSCLVSVLYNLTDTAFVGMLNDPVQTAAVTLAAPVLLAFNAVNNLFGVGSSSMMSRALGRGDMKTLRESSAFGFWGAFLCGVLYSALCAVFCKPLLSLLGADALTAGPTERYLFYTVMLGATPSILNVVMAYLIRSEGATLHASIGTMSGCLLNIVLDPIFILPWGFDMGAEGAALATLLSNVFAVFYFLCYLLIRRKRTCVCISPRAISLSKDIVVGVCAVGVPASIQNLLNVLSHTLLNHLTAPYGAQALAGMGIASKISMLPLYMSMGISQGVMPLIGYTYASRRIPRMKQAIRFTAGLSLTVLSVVGALFVIFARPITSAFIGDAQTISYGVTFMRALVLSIPFLAMDFLAVGVFQAVGKGALSLFMACARKLLLEIPAMFLLERLWPLYGLSCAQLCAEVVMSIVATALLARLIHRLDAGKA